MRYSNDACIRKGYGCLFFAHLPYIDFEAVINTAKWGHAGLSRYQKGVGGIEPAGFIGNVVSLAVLVVKVVQCVKTNILLMPCISSAVEEKVVTVHVRVPNETSE